MDISLKIFMMDTKFLVFLVLALMVNFSFKEIKGSVILSSNLNHLDEPGSESEVVKILQGALERISVLETKYTKLATAYDHLESICSEKRAATLDKEEVKGQSSAPVPKDLESDVAFLKQSLVNVQSDVSTLNSVVFPLVADVSGLKSEVSSLSGVVTSLEVEIGHLPANLTSLITDVQTLKSDLRNLTSEIGDLPQNVSGLQVDLEELKPRVSGLEADVDELKSGVEELNYLVEENHIDVLYLGIKIDDLHLDQLRLDLDALTPIVWSVEAFRKEMTYTTLPDLREDLQSLTYSVETVQSSVSQLRKAVAPVGFTYIQYDGEATPGDLWPPAFTWEKIASQVGYSVYKQTDGSGHL